MRKVLVIDDERPILDMLELSLSSEEYEVVTAENGEEALEIFEQQRPKLVLTDIKMPGIDGIEVLKRIKAMDIETEVIVVTGHGDMDTAISALQNGASDFVTKPISDEVLMVALERAEKKLAMSEQLKDYTENLEGKMQECKLDLKEAQDDLIRTERLATIGETVAGLAHCIKNILTGLGGGMYMVHAGMAKEKAGMLEDGWAMFQRNMERVSDLVLDLLRYSRQALPERASCNPNRIASDVARSLESLASKHDVNLKTFVDPSLTEAFIERSSIHRVLMHLVSNAIDACIYDKNSAKKGEVTLQTKIETDQDFNKKLIFEITDNGCGITDEVKTQLFQRFFSTKAGHGAGIGLLVTQKIVQEHGGEISIESKDGEGTTVTVQLPVNTEPG